MIKTNTLKTFISLILYMIFITAIFVVFKSAIGKENFAVIVLILTTGFICLAAVLALADVRTQSIAAQRENASALIEKAKEETDAHQKTLQAKLDVEKEKIKPETQQKEIEKQTLHIQELKIEAEKQSSLRQDKLRQFEMILKENAKNNDPTLLSIILQKSQILI